MKRRPLMVFGLLALLALVCCASGAAQAAAPPDTPLSLTGAAPGQATLLGDRQNVDLLGQIGGAFSAVAIQGVYAYVGSGPRLVVLDVTPDREPTKVGETSPLATWVSDIAVVGTYAYVGVGQDGLRVINVANPSVPLVIGSFTGGSVGALQVVGHYAYVVDSGAGLRVLDVADPAHPTQVGVYAASYPRDVTVLGHYAYLAGTYMGLNIVDVADPTRPTLVGSYQASFASSVEVVGHYAYLLEGSLDILDVSNPAAPVEVGSYTNMHGTSQVHVAFGLAYVVYRGGLMLLDVSTPESVAFVGDYGLSDAVGVAVAGQYAYLVAPSVMAVLDLDEPNQPNRIGTYTSFDRVSAVAADGRTAYVAAGQGLYLVDVSSPSALAQTGYLWDRYDAEDVALSGNYAYVAFGDDGLHVVDVSTPGGRTVASESGSSVRGVAIADQHAYVTGFTSRLRALDVSTGWPRQVSPTLPGKGYRVALMGRYAYVAAFDDGVRIVDVSDPAHLTEVGSYTPTGSSSSTAYDVAVAGHYAYVGLGSGGLDIVDITNPAATVQVGRYNPPEGASVEGIEVVGRYAYLASRALGLRVVDVINPASPVEVGFFTGFGRATSVAVKGDTIYVGTVSEGMWLLRFTGAPHLVTSAFRPLPNGYRFANAKGHASCAILRDAFKPGQVDPTCYLLPGRADYNATVKKVEGGSCFGTSLSSALLYEGWAIPSDFLSQHHVARTYDLPSPCPGGAEGCRDSGWDATAVADFIVRHQAYGLGHQYQANRLATQQRGLSETVRLITQSVDAGLRDPYLIEVWGSYRGTCAGHALVPYAYDQSGARTNVYVYDPNHPAGTDQVVTFDMSGPGAWRYDLNFSKLASETIVWQSGEQCASVAVTPVSLFKQKQDAPWWPFPSAGKGDAAATQHYVTARGDGELLLTDNQGRRLGFQDGAFFDEIPNAMRDIPLTGVLPGVTPDYPDSYLLATATPFTMSFQRGGSGPLQVTDIAPGGIAQIAGWGQHLSTDVIHTDPALRRASVTAGSPGSDRSLRLVAVAPNQVTSAEVMDFSLGGQQTAALAFGDQSSTQDSVRFTSGSAGQYRVWLARQAGADLTEFRATRIPLNADATHTLSIDWANPGVVRLEVDDGSDGTVDRTIALTNEAGRYKIALPVIIQSFSLSHAGP